MAKIRARTGQTLEELGRKLHIPVEGLLAVNPDIIDPRADLQRASVRIPDQSTLTQEAREALSKLRQRRGTNSLSLVGEDEERSGELTCPKCGLLLLEESKFCNYCGSATTGVGQSPGQSPLASPIVKYGGGFILICVGLMVFGMLSMCISGNQSANSDESTQNASQPTNQSPPDTTSQSETTTQAVVDAATPEPPPIEKPKSVEEEKAEFKALVDTDVTGTRLIKNPFKFVGRDVSVVGTVGQIIDSEVFNFVPDGAFASIAVRGDATTLEEGQRLRILGVVGEPMEGTNLMGGAGHWASVDAKYLEPISSQSRKRHRRR